MNFEVVAKASDTDRHKEDIESVIVHGNRVFSAADDGKVKVWSSLDLSLVHQFKAHEYGIMNILVFEDHLFTASVDDTIKVWLLNSWDLVKTLVGHEATPKKLVAVGQNIYSGDDKGEILKWDKDGNLLGKIDVAEEVWDLCIRGNIIYSIRERGLTITETREDSKRQTIVSVVEGRAPFLINENDIYLCDRSGLVIDHFSNTLPKCEHLQDFKGGHKKLITVLNGFGSHLISGGWDEELVLWSVEKHSIVSSIPIPGCPSSIAISEHDSSIFVGGSDGFLIKVKLVAL